MQLNRNGIPILTLKNLLEMKQGLNGGNRKPLIDDTPSLVKGQVYKCKIPQ